MLSRPVQLVWVAGVVLILIAAFTTLGGDKTGVNVPQWVQEKTGIKPSSDHNGIVEKMRLSEKLWRKSVDQRHALLKKDWPEPDKMPLFPAINTPTYFATPYSIWDFIPASYNCPHEVERIGAMGDGGKWVCGMSQYEKIPEQKPCVIYSFGINSESSYEEETLSRTHCEIWGYDFSVDHYGPQLSAENAKMAHFTKAGIAGATDTTKNPPFYSIKDLMKINGHDYIDILKIDIEYAEFEAMESVMADFPGEIPIGQMLMEIHLFGYKGTTSGGFLKWWEKLEERGFRPAWTEPNLLYTTARVENAEPRLAEYTLVNVQDKRNVLFEGAHRL